MRFEFDLATPNDDKALRRLLKETPMEGPVKVSFGRDPDFFQALEAEALFYQVCVARDAASREMAGFGCRSVKAVYINGVIDDIGYLSGLRIRPHYRKTTLLARSYQYLHEQHLDKRVSYYLTSIIEGNDIARRLLVSERAGLPSYIDRGKYITSLVPLTGKGKLTSGLKVSRGSLKLLDAIVDCLNRNGKEKQFYPVYSKEFFLSDRARELDFNINNFYIAFKGNEALGVLAKWDQRAFKQIHIMGYSGGLQYLRPFYNFAAAGSGWLKLPRPGAMLNSFYLAFIAVDQNDPEIFRALLSAIYNDHLGLSYDCLMTGLHEQDPLLKVVREEFRPLSFLSRVYGVCWDDGRDFNARLDDRTPYLELATL